MPKPLGLAIYATIILLGAWRVALTHRVFSETLDEPVHVACGYEWLTGRGYLTDPTHPPLERVLSAAPLVLMRIPPPTQTDFVGKGNDLLYANDRYEKNLARARMGNLFLFIAGMIALAAWAHRLFGFAVGAVATALFATLPPILAHAGLATTDLAVATTLTVSLIALDFWLDAPTLRRGVLLGIAIALGVLSKFSFLLFFPVAALVLIGVRVGKRNAALDAKSLALAAAIGFLLIWAGYRFSFGRLDAIPMGKFYLETPAPRPLRPLAKWVAEQVPLPMPELFMGVGAVKMHDIDGHPAYLLGRYSQRGWWYYFPVVFFYKTPLPFLILAAWGIALLLRRRPEIAWIPIALMLCVLPSSINIGIRHLLPIYPPLCIAAAFATVTIARQSRDLFGRAALAALLGWLVIGTTLAHPDYLAWFNEAAGEHPEAIVVDSNLDWGQDVLRLERVVREQNIDRLLVLYNGNADLGRHRIPAAGLQPFSPAQGWIAASETSLKIGDQARQGGYRWLDQYRPVRRIGKSIRLYHIR